MHKPIPEVVKGALAMVRTLASAATRREHAQCDGVSVRCMFCEESAYPYPELEEAGIAPWPPKRGARD